MDAYYAKVTTSPNQLENFAFGPKKMLYFDTKLAVDTLLENMAGEDITKYKVVTEMRAIPEEG